MKNLKNILFISLLAGLFIFSSCKKDDEMIDPTPMEEALSIAEIASENPDFSILVEALDKAGLVSTLNSSGTYTVFAPTNDAFEALFDDLGVNGIADLDAEALTPILLYHVLGATAMSNTLESNYVSTLSPSQDSYLSMYIEVGSEVKINNNAMVTQADMEASNGVIHVIDKVILPATIVDLAVANSDFSSLTAALVQEGLAEVLSSTSSFFTVFAPNNDAFSNYLSESGFSGLGDIPSEALTDVLLYHVIGSSIKSTDLTAGYAGSLLTSFDENATSLLIGLDNGVTINSNSMVIAADIIGTNGVIHAVDQVISPQTVVDIAINNPDFSILVEAVVKAGLVETLSSEGPFTVFAPTNDAFNELFATLNISGIADLTAEDLIPILQYHVVTSNVLASELTEGKVTTLNGDVLISLNPPAINSDSQIILTDVQGTNGVVHAISKVLLP
jgi:transforming growth factor-beta-induced protein